MDFGKAVVGCLLAGAITLGLHKAGIWGRQVPQAPYPPTPAALATRAADAAAARAAAARQQEAERLAALQRPQETPEALPEGAAREEVFFACTACHATAVIRRSRLSRDRWDELMDWMTQRHGMNPLEGAQRERIVDYLAEHFPPARGRGRGGNPFATE